MTTAAQKTREDLRQKLALEVRFRKKLNTLNRRMAKSFQNQLAVTGTTLQAVDYRDDYEMLLADQYARTGKVFSDKISKTLPDDVTQTEEERLKIKEALGLYYLLRSGEQSLIITETNQKNINDSVIKGTEEAAQDEGGYTLAAAATIAGTLLIRKLNGRRDTIALTETQNAAEAAKQTESEVLSGVEPSITTLGNQPVKIPKEWVTVGDQDVRETHANADGQERDLTDFYDVGGYDLMRPGDSDHGAPPSEIINCRCSSQTDDDKIIERRRDNSIEDI